MIRTIFILLALQLSFSQNYWQQHVEYEMDIVVDVSDFTYDGEQSIIYTNNSNDTIKRFIIIYFLMLLSQTARWIFAPGQLETPTEEWGAE